MQVVIDIHDTPKNDHERYILSHGTPLPKGHGDLIDRDWVMKMKCTDLVDADGVTMYAVPTGNILRMIPVVQADKEGD